MADDADRAASLQEREIAAALAAHATRDRTAREECLTCGEDLPHHRRAIGAQRCFHCQTEHEHRAHLRGVRP